MSDADATPAEHPTSATPGLRHLVICGGGIAGLSAAWEAVQRGVPTITVIDAGPDLGGKLRTTEVGGLMVDEGADAFLIRVPAALELCRELGLDTRLVHPAASNAELFYEETRQRFPEGLVLGVPTSPEELAEYPYLGGTAQESVQHELSAEHEPIVADMSIGAFIRQRFDDEIADLLVEPLVGGINAGNIDGLSMDAVVPQLAAAARQPGSFAANLARARSSAPIGGPIFATTDGGIRPMIDALVAGLVEAGVHFLTGVAVSRISASGSGIHVHTSPRESQDGPDDPMPVIAADGVILALPASQAAATTQGVGELADLLARIPTASVVVVTMVWPGSPFDLPAAGVLIPRIDDSTQVTAISYASTKWPRLSRSPDGEPRTVLRVSLGYDGNDGCADWDDDAILAEARAQVERILGPADAPSHTRVSRWPKGFSQYRPGHLELVAAIDSELEARLGAVTVAGSAFHGIGIPSSITSGREAVGRVIQRVAPGGASTH
jgi:oxygen-dependent protoporphyrinogen oxidase